MRQSPLSNYSRADMQDEQQKGCRHGDGLLMFADQRNNCACAVPAEHEGRAAAGRNHVPGETQKVPAATAATTTSRSAASTAVNAGAIAQV